MSTEPVQSHPKTNKERLEELISKIHSLRMNKLFTLEKIQEKEVKNVESLEALDKKLGEIQADLLEDKIDYKKAMVLIKIIGARKTIIAGLNSSIKECRLILTTLVKEEGKYQFEYAKAQAETS